MSQESIMDELLHDTSSPITPCPETSIALAALPIVSLPPSQKHLCRPPLLSTADHPEPVAAGPKTPKSRDLTPGFLAPLGSPLQVTELGPQDAWLPITKSRNGNAYHAAVHTLCSGIGVQALVLPVAFTILGWTWGVICLTLAFIWQIYTLYLMVQLHESTETGLRYSRYMQMATAAFGDKLARLLAAFPILYLSGGTCVALIVIGGSTSKLFYQTLCGCMDKPLTSVEWYLVFTTAAVILSQLTNFNSIAGVSLVGATTAIGFSTLIWVVSLTRRRLPGVSYEPVRGTTRIAWVFDVLNAIGIVAFAFGDTTSYLRYREKHPSRVPMWRGVKIAYLIIAMCLFPVAIAGYWTYGQEIPANGGMLKAVYTFHSRDVSTSVLGLISLLVIINAACSFQIYGMHIFDDIESVYTARFKRPCPWWLRAIIRAMFGYGCFLVAIAIPFLGSVAGLVGGLALLTTLSHPCFMWLKFKRPKTYSPTWCLNWALGLLGTGLSGLLIAAGVYVIINNGIQLSFFQPN